MHAMKFCHVLDLLRCFRKLELNEASIIYLVAWMIIQKHKERFPKIFIIKLKNSYQIRP